MSFAWIREPGKKSIVFSLREKNDGDFYFAPFDGQLIQLSISKAIIKNCDKWVKSNLKLTSLPKINLNDSHSKSDYLKLVQKALSSCKNNALEKVVLSRTKAHKLGSVSPVEMFNKLCDQYPLASVYMILIDGFTLWIGATPECLMELDGNQFRTMSLAATRPINYDGKWGIKEEEEQQLVTRDIVQMLDALGCQNINMGDPKTLAAGPVEHLCSLIEAFHPLKNALKTARSLHPTPAVGGLPRAQSKAFILQHENYNRYFYSGYFGWQKDNRSIFYVNLRCMELGNNGILSYAGAGITSKSKPEDEWNETEEKLKTLHRVILE